MKCFTPLSLRSFLILLFFMTATLASAGDLTNADIIKMAAAHLDETIIVTAIQNSAPKFDVSTQGLIDLSAAKVPQNVITEMIRRSSKPANEIVATSSEKKGLSPSDVILIDGDTQTPMRYLNPQMRTALRGLGFGGMASYAVLRGSAANYRVKNASPAFLVSVPNQAQVESYITLASFAVRKNNSREVMIGGGYMSYSSGVHPDRIVQFSSEKLPDQSQAQTGFTIYKISPIKPLPAGEYAIILYTGEMQGLVSTWFSGTGNSYFDFGVDP